MRYLGIDYGSKRIGLATGDDNGFGAFPLLTITRSRSLRHDLAEIARLAEKESAAAIVVGLPVNEDGSQGPSAVAASEFSRALAKHTALPITLHNEYGSTMDAEEILLEADVSRAKRRAKIDQVAAASILRSFLREKEKSVGK